MSELIKEIYGEDFKKTPFQVLLQLDRYTVKELDTSKVKKGDIVVGVYDDSNSEFPQKDFGRVTEVDGEFVSFVGEITTQTHKVHLRKIMLPLDFKWEDSVDRYVKGSMTIEEKYQQKDRKQYEKRIRKALHKEQVVPGGRIQASIGGFEKFAKDLNLTAYNCFVIPSPRDSRRGIMDTLMIMTEIMSRGGGVGINVSTLRPRYAKVYGVNGTSSGSTSWGGLYSYVTGLIEQAGSRRGALMLQTHISHPDIKEFITVKRTMGKMTNANLSVQITKEFMEVVKRDGDWQLIYPDTKHPEYDKNWAVKYLDIHDWLNAGLPVEVYETIKAKELYNLIIESAHSSAEPGFVIYDNMNDGRMTPTQALVKEKDKHTFVVNKAVMPVEKVVPWNNTFYYQKNVCTNPCGEQPLPGYGICNLIHINLAGFYDSKTKDVDWKELKQVIHDTVRFADNVIDYTKYFIEENEKVQKEQRRIGMGTMGLADLLIDMKIRYGGDAVPFIEKLYGFIKNEAYRASAILAEQRGKFETFDIRILEARIPSSLDEDVKELIKKDGLRNSHLLTQAPTGTTGTKTGAKGYSVATGIEPFFALSWERESRMGKTLDYLGKAKEYLEVHGVTELPNYFVSAMGVNEDGTPEISPMDHVKVQAAIQRHNDSAISKTTNAPNDYTIEQTAELYQFGVDMDLVGITLYRDGSRDKQVLTSTDNLKEDVAVEETKTPAFYKRPTRLVGETIQTPTPFGKAYVTINRHPDMENIEEVFINLGKTGADIASIGDGLAIALTGLLSPRISNLTEAEKVAWIIKKFKGITGQTSVGFGPNAVSSLPDAIAKVFVKMNESTTSDSDSESAKGIVSEAVIAPKKNNVDSVDICPNCGQSTFVKQDGCTTCLTDLGGCGHSKC